MQTLENVAKTDGLQTIILHLEADDTDGIIEVYTDDGGLIYSYSGPVHVGMRSKNLVLNSSYCSIVRLMRYFQISLYRTAS